jgi:DNA-binding IclR family transcriptional regulator
VVDTDPTTHSSGSPTAAVRSVSRALALVDAVTEAVQQDNYNGITLADAARNVGLPVTTAARLLSTLEAENAVRRDHSGRWYPGVRLLALSSRLKSAPLITVAGPELENLAERTNESAYLAIRSGDEAVYIRHVDSAQPIRHTAWVGRSWPIHGTAIGAALLGSIPLGGVATTRDTIEPGVTAVAAPIWDKDTRGVVAALSCAGPTFRIDEDRLAQIAAAVSESAQRLSQFLDL